MPKPERMFVNGRYGQVHLRVAKPDVASAYPPLVCLHMSPKSGRSFQTFMAAASNDRMIIAPDYPGYGESDAPPQEPPVTIQDYASSVWEAVHAADLFSPSTKIDLLGHHTGSKVAAEMAHQKPQSVNQIVMISASVLYPDELRKFEATYTPIELDEEGTRFRIMWERIVEHRGAGMTLEMMATSLAENLRGGEAYEWGHRAAFEYNKYFVDIVKELSHKVVVLNPGDDLYQFTPRIMEFLQNGELVNCQRWGHGFLDAHTQDAITEITKALS